MRVKKEQIISGIAEYLEKNIIPAMSDDRGMQVILYAAIKAFKNNEKLTEAQLHNQIMQTLMDDDGSGTYDIEALFEYLQGAVEKFGFFPLYIKPIPQISPTEKVLKFTVSDLEQIKKKIVGELTHE